MRETMTASSVLFITEHGDSASSWVRANVPGKGLAKRGWTTCLSSVMFQDDDGLIRGAAPAKDGNGLGPLPPTKYVVLRRINDLNGNQTRMVKLMERAKRAGQRLFWDLDDDPWSLPEWNPAHGEIRPKQLQYWEKDMQAADGILVTTPALGMSTADHIKHVPVFVCANGVDLDDFEPEVGDIENDPLRLGWIGTVDYRGRDFAIIVDALREALADCWGEVEFWHHGARYPLLDSIHALLGPRFPVQVREVPWLPLQAMNHHMSHLDAALIPQEDHPFNNARSATTGIKLMAAGVPFVASSRPSYDTLWRQGGGYAIENDYGTWLQSIRMMIAPEYKAARRDIRTSGLLLARARYGCDSVAEDWEKAFAS